jgi:hypothetical protein
MGLKFTRRLCHEEGVAPRDPLAGRDLEADTRPRSRGIYTGRCRSYSSSTDRLLRAHVVQRIERRITNPGVAGPNPAVGTRAPTALIEILRNNGTHSNYIYVVDSVNIA